MPLYTLTCFDFITSPHNLPAFVTRRLAQLTSADRCIPGELLFTVHNHEHLGYYVCTYSPTMSMHRVIFFVCIAYSVPYEPYTNFRMDWKKSRSLSNVNYNVTELHVFRKELILILSSKHTIPPQISLAQRCNCVASSAIVIRCCLSSVYCNASVL